MFEDQILAKPLLSTSGDNSAWNIIFIAVDINEQYDNGTEIPEDDVIEMGIQQFQREVQKSNYHETIKISMLHFRHKSTDGKAITFNAVPTDPKDVTASKYVFQEHNNFKNANNFESHNPTHYSDYFRFLNLSESSKTMIIFLAHSIGVGFLRFPVNPEVGTSPTYFTINKLNDALALLPKKVDCLLALNCTLQSIETNCILRNTVKYLIGSQQPLFPEAVYYQRLIFDLAKYSATDKAERIHRFYTDEHIFTKFILNCHKKYTETGGHKSNTFCLSLSKPDNARFFMFYLEFFAASLGKFKSANDRDIVYQAKVYCKDPDKDDNVSFLDAHCFFDKLNAYFDKNGNSVKEWLLERIIFRLKNILIYHLADGNCVIGDDGFSPNASIYVPYGLALFLIKKTSDGTPTADAKDVRDIYVAKIKEESFLLQDEEWLKVVTGELGPSQNKIGSVKCQSLLKKVKINVWRKKYKKDSFFLKKLIDHLSGLNLSLEPDNNR